MYNPFSLEGKTILVTGASSGIGRATAIECSRLGARVCITGRKPDRLNETMTMLQGEGHRMFAADLMRMEDISRLADELPILNGCVNNAGITKTIPTPFISAEALNEVMQVNALAPIMLTQQLLKKKKIQKGGSVVFSASISGIYCVVFGNSLYSASKGAVNGFVKNAALDLAAKNIRVNAVCPGMVDTGILNAGIITPEQLEAERMKYPLKRFGKPEEIAYAIVYLLSDAASFVTGTSLLIDGGFTLQ